MNAARNSVWRFGVVIAVAAVIGCVGSLPSRAAEPDLRIGGTGASLGIAGILLTEVQKRHPDIAGVVLPSLGSGGGIRALAAGALDVAFSSRPLKEKEKGNNLRFRLLGGTPMIIAVRPDNPRNNLDIDDLKAMLMGDIDTWKNGVGVRFVMRPPNETDTVVFLRRFPALEPAWRKMEKRLGAFVAYTDQQNAKTIESLRGAIGLGTLVQLISEKRRLKALALNGVTPSVETIASDRYPLVRDLFIVTRPDPDPKTQAYVDFIFSEAGRDILLQNGVLPKAAGK